MKTPTELFQAWPDGVPQTGRISLDLTPEAAAAKDFLDLLPDSFDTLAEAVSDAGALFDTEFRLSLSAQRAEGSKLFVKYQFSRPATDAMIWILRGIDALNADIVGGLYSAVSVHPAMSAQAEHRMLAASSTQMRFIGPDGAVLPPSELGRFAGLRARIALPFGVGERGHDLDAALLRIGALADERVFDEGTQDRIPESDPPGVFTGEDGQDWVGVWAYWGGPSYAYTLIAAVEAIMRQQIGAVAIRFGDVPDQP